jgi:hypothetical protein
VLGDLVQQDDARGVVVGVRSEDDDRDDQAEDVHGQAALGAGHPLGRITATREGGDPGGVRNRQDLWFGGSSLAGL